MKAAIRREHMVMRFINCGACGVRIESYDDDRGTPRKYCDRICRNVARRARREAKEKVLK